jgi:hypothetical protein
MFLEVDEDHIENDEVYYIRNLLENSEVIHNCDIESSTEISAEEAGY